jgi:hypothetical protein
MTVVEESSNGQTLAEWSLDHPVWVIELAKAATECHGALSEEKIDEIFSIFLVENSLADGQIEQVQVATLTPADEGPKVTVRLDKLTHLGGVNALKTPSEIEFNPTMTLVFGENAAGKSGYVRILKALSSSRCQEDVLSHAGSEDARSCCLHSWGCLERG